MRRHLYLRLLVLIALVWGVVLAVGALAGGSGEAEDDRLPVVATTPQVADLVAMVGGDRIQLTRLLPVGADPHDHELRPSDVTALARARVTVLAGGEVDHWAHDVAEGERLELLEHVRRRGDDPHWWQDPRNSVLAVAAVRDALTRADPGGREAYERAAAGAASRIEALDRAIERCWGNVAPARRVLVSSHDSYGYYAARYGLRVLGSVIPSLSSRGQASAGETARLVRDIRRSRVRAVFSERALGGQLERTIAEQAGAEIGRPLFGDALGPPGSGGETYLRALAADTQALVDGLAGRRVACDLPA